MNIDDCFAWPRLSIAAVAEGSDESRKVCPNPERSRKGSKPSNASREAEKSSLKIDDWFVWAKLSIAVVAKGSDKLGITCPKSGRSKMGSRPSNALTEGDKFSNGPVEFLDPNKPVISVKMFPGKDSRASSYS